MTAKIPSHWGADGGNPTPPCEFLLFVSSAFKGVPPGRHLGRCDNTPITTMYVQKPPAKVGPTEKFKVCSKHLGFARETQAQKDGEYGIPY